MKRFMLDTDAVSYAIRGLGGVRDRLLAHSPSSVVMSSISFAELRFGVEKRRSRRLSQGVDDLAKVMVVLPFDAGAARVYGALAARLLKAGTPIGQLDTFIAAHALALGVTLVTNNTKHYSKVSGLALENWM